MLQRMIGICLVCVCLLVQASPFPVATPHPRYIAYTAAWKDGRIAWYYNPAGQPAWLTTDAAVAVIKQGMQQWQDACQLDFVYMGETSAPAVRQDGVSTLGWGDTVGYPYTNFWWNASYTINEGDIQFRAASFGGPSDFAANVVHEVGHLLGLSHSDRPASVMFANGYNTYNYQATLKGDDIAACARLYGGRGLISHTDLQAQASESYNGYRLSLEVTLTEPNASTASSVSSVAPDYRGNIYFNVRYDGVPIGETLTLRLVAPDGSHYDSYNFTTTYASPSWYWFYNDLSISPMRKLTGKWEAQVLRAGRVLARQSYVMGNAYPDPVVAENTLIARPAAPGGVELEARNLQSAATQSSYRWWVNARNFGTNVSSAAAALQVGENIVNLFATSSNSRYANTEANMPDAIARMRLVLDEQGWPVANRFDGDITGDRAAATLDAHLGLRSSGQQAIYILLFHPDGLLWKTPSGWQSTAAPLMYVTAPAAVSVPVWDRLDLRKMPSSSIVFAGYGVDLNDVLARGQFGALYTVP